MSSRSAPRSSIQQSPAADLQQRSGSRAVRSWQNAGLSNLPDVPSLALGTGVVSPLDLTSAYTMFAAMASGPVLAG